MKTIETKKKKTLNIFIDVSFDHRSIFNVAVSTAASPLLQFFCFTNVIVICQQ